MTIAGRRALSAAAVLLALVALTLAARPAAAAAPIGSDGLVHACYKAKGKPKGALRVVKPGKKCKAKKGEKAIAWSIFGAPGTGGSQGSTGATGTDAASQQDILTLLGMIQQQSAVIDQLTGQLNSLGLDVTGLTSKLSGITNADLLSAIGAAPVLDAVCDQLATVTDQTDALRSVLGVVDTLLVGTLNLPAALGTFACPTP